MPFNTSKRKIWGSKTKKKQKEINSTSLPFSQIGQVILSTAFF